MQIKNKNKTNKKNNKTMQKTKQNKNKNNNKKRKKRWINILFQNLSAFQLFLWEDSPLYLGSEDTERTQTNIFIKRQNPKKTATRTAQNMGMNLDACKA